MFDNGTSSDWYHCAIVQGFPGTLRTSSHLYGSLINFDGRCIPLMMVSKLRKCWHNAKSMRVQFLTFPMKGEAG